MPSLPSSSSYCLPAKYGGDVTTSATHLSAIALMSRASPQKIVSATGQSLTSSSSEIFGAGNRA